MPTTILKIQSGKVDSRGRFHPRGIGAGGGAGWGLPSRTVSPRGTANTRRRQGKYHAHLLVGTGVPPNYYKGSKMEAFQTLGAAKAWLGTQLSKTRDVTARGLIGEDKGGVFKTVHEMRPNPSLKALLGSGQWKRAKVRPTPDGKVEVLLVGNGGGLSAKRNTSSEAKYGAEITTRLGGPFERAGFRTLRDARAWINRTVRMPRWGKQAGYRALVKDLTTGKVVHEKHGK